MKDTGERPRLTQGRLFYREDLATDIELILRGDPHAADVLARLLIAFKRAIDSGLDGIDQTSYALQSAVELTYHYSHAYKASLTLYLLSQQGELKVEDEPGNLINAAINRTLERIQPGRVGRKAHRG